ncbi:Sporulation kinase A [bioreactor metagenome]|uniref:Sporulation kinase A n=1 Tax=bioreactor metagenome TaxID=1076179 RepID=A0A645FR82_9ZZZZ
MVQVITNLVNNAIDAMRPKGGGSINIDISSDSQALKITVKDYGTGVPEDVKNRLFKQMITSKGAQGTGLGIFISNSVIKAKFGGSMWYEDNPAGGAIFGISIPLEYVTSGIKKGGDGT